MFGIDFTFLSSEAAWEAFYGVVADEAGTPAEVANFLAYAFNRNPADGDTAGTQFPGSYGITQSNDDEYLSVTFDFVSRATDLQYTIQADVVTSPTRFIRVIVDSVETTQVP